MFVKMHNLCYQWCLVRVWFLDDGWFVVGPSLLVRLSLFSCSTESTRLSMLDLKNLQLKCMKLADDIYCASNIWSSFPCQINICRKRDKAGSAFCGKAAEHGHRRRRPGAFGVQGCGNATAAHLLEERQWHNPSLKGQS